MLRTFIAFKLPENIIAVLKRLQGALKKTGMDIRWVQPGSMHLTLKFLGDTPVEKCPEIERAIETATGGFKPLNLAVKGVGVFPGIKNARVLWAGLSGETAALLDFQRHLENQLAEIGFEKEKRTFKAHLTVGRIKQKLDPTQLLSSLKACGDFESENFGTHRIILYKSDLQPTGAIYTPLYTKICT